MTTRPVKFIATALLTGFQSSRVVWNPMSKADKCSFIWNKKLVYTHLKWPYTQNQLVALHLFPVLRWIELRNTSFPTVHTFSSSQYGVCWWFRAYLTPTYLQPPYWCKSAAQIRSAAMLIWVCMHKRIYNTTTPHLNCWERDAIYTQFPFDDEYPNS